jgi:hypothetical protein
VASLTVLALLLAPFVVARAVRFAAPWSDLRVPTVIFGVLTILGTIVGSAVGEGFGQYVLVLVWYSWITVLSVRMGSLAKEASHPVTIPARGPVRS